MKKLYLRIGIFFLGLGIFSGLQGQVAIENTQATSNPTSDQELPVFIDQKIALSQIEKITGKAGKIETFKEASQQYIGVHHPRDLKKRGHTIKLKDNNFAYPTFIVSEGGIHTRALLANQDAALTASHLYLEEIASLLPIKKASEEFSLKSYHQDQIGHTHVKLQQQFHGIPVFGAEVVVHFQPGGQRVFNGTYTRTPIIHSIEPQLELEEAILIATNDMHQHTKVRALNTFEQKMLKMHERKRWELVIYPLGDPKDSHRLAYHLDLHPNFIDHWTYFIDAETGEILNQYNKTCSLVPPVSKTETHLNGNTYTMGTFQADANTFVLLDASKSMFKGNPNNFPSVGDGIIVTLDLQNQPADSISDNRLFSSENNTYSEEARSAHINSIVSYDYFEQIHQRQSINGEGNDVIAFVNVTEDDGSGLDNAFWNGFFMFYGSGDFAFDPLMGGLDVGGHELTHGVVQETANLVYQNQPGALNESFADIFGFLIEGEEDFRIGEDITKGNIFRSGALRNMLDPNNGGNSLNDNGYQPASFEERFTGSEDNGGVHINSGIPNRAFALFYQAVGKSKAERVYYRALNEYLTRTSQFLDCREVVIQSCLDLFPGSTTEAEAAAAAYDAVGIRSADQGGEETQEEISFPAIDLNPNPGADFIAVTDAEANSTTPIVRYDPRSGQFLRISNARNIKPISISDTGSRGVFVDENNEIRIIFDLSTPNPQESFLFRQEDSLNVWTNAVISKDGTKIAATTGDLLQDTSIYIIDIQRFANQEENFFRRFKLFNPTTAQGGLSTSGVLFSDAITFDHSGQFIMYDALNLAETPGGTYEFWDIGLIKVWDNDTDDFGDGNIFKLFNVDQGESIGNAVFAQNSNYIITFDLRLDPDSLNEDFRYFVYASNINTGDIQQVVENNTIGFPHYSVDDNMITYTEEDGNSLNVRQIAIGNDKITPQGGDQGLFSGGEWAVWYAIGSRDLNTPNAPMIIGEHQILVYPNPMNDQLLMDLDLEKGIDVKYSLINAMGQSVLQKAIKTNSGTQTLHLEVPQLPAGMYWLRIEMEGQQRSIQLIKK